MIKKKFLFYFIRWLYCLAVFSLTLVNMFIDEKTKNCAKGPKRKCYIKNLNVIWKATLFSGSKPITLKF